jgi:stage II sporulation SpoE-like protein
VKTITKIVGVVPAAMRALIGLLMALALALGMRSRVAALRARRLDRQRVQLLEDVGLLQAALLPVPPARLGPVATSVAYRPANGPGAGGDFYDVFALEDGRLGVIVGDISGHGRQALPHTALVRFTLRAYLEAGLSPRDAIKTAGAVLEGALGGAFATVVVATYHPRERLLTYSCAGHPPPVVLGAEALVTRTVGGAPPIGTGMRTGTRQTVVSLPGYAQVCLHTDGVTEARVGSDLFGGKRLASTLSKLGPQADAKALLDSVASQTDARPDDMAACLLTVTGDAQPPAVLVEQLELDSMGVESDRIERFLLVCGVSPAKADELMHSARAALSLGGPLQIEAHPREDPVRVELHRDNVAPLLPRQARAAVGAGGLR